MFGIPTGELAAIGTALLWTLSVLAWTSAGKHVGALAVCFIRLLVACVFLMAYGQLVRGRPFPDDAPGETWTILLLSGFAGFFIADVFLFKALVMIGPRLTLLLQTLVAPIAAITSWWFLHELLNAKDLLAMLVTLSGVTWVVLERNDERGKLHDRKQMQWGLVLAFLAAIGQALGLVLSREGMAPRAGMESYDAGAATFIRVIGALIGFVPLITLARRWPVMVNAATHARAMKAILFGTLVGPFLGVILSMVAVRHAHAAVVGTILSTMPVLVLPFVIVLYGEKVSIRAVAGAVISVVGVALLVC